MRINSRRVLPTQVKAGVEEKFAEKTFKAQFLEVTKTFTKENGKEAIKIKFRGLTMAGKPVLNSRGEELIQFATFTLPEDMTYSDYQEDGYWIFNEETIFTCKGKLVKYNKKSGDFEKIWLYEVFDTDIVTSQENLDEFMEQL